MDWDNVLSDIQHFDEYLTSAELDKRTYDMQKRYSDIMSLKIIGKTEQGKDILCLKIGEGNLTALVYGTPHPNEPIGTLMTEALLDLLVGNEKFRKEMGYTWYIIKSIDIDGLKRNEGWLKGKNNIAKYQHNFFRPAFDRQVEWSFPFQYKNYVFHTPTRGTQALMHLIDEINPDFIYSLHNSSFGGCYWYLTKGNLELYKQLQEIAEKNEIPLHMGEPEVPYCKSLGKAVYQMFGAKERCEYYEKNMPEIEFNRIMTGGASGYEYASRNKRKVVNMLVSEVPFYLDEKISDTNLSDKTVEDVLSSSCQLTLEDLAFVECVLNDIASLFSVKNEYYVAAMERMGMKQELEKRLSQIVNNPSMQINATIGQTCSIQETRFYSNLTIVLMRRACDEELDNFTHSEKEKILLQNARSKLYLRECENISVIEKRRYAVAPIDRLVRVQLECGLIYAEYLKNK